MPAHMRKRRTNPFQITKKVDEKKSMDWKEAAKELFGETSNSALNLRGLRNREGFTQAQLGEAIGIEQSNISKMERGQRPISPKVAKRLEKLFDIDYRLFL